MTWNRLIYEMLLLLASFFLRMASYVLPLEGEEAVIMADGLYYISRTILSGKESK